MTVSVPIRGSTFTATARIALMQRDQLTRIDLLSVESAALPIRIPRITMVISRRTNSVIVWNDATRLYYSQSLFPGLGAAAAQPGPVPDASARPAPARRSNLANLDLMTFNMRLTGRTATAGIRATGFAFDMKVRQRGSATPVHLTGSVQLADDFAYFPAALQARIQAGSAMPATFSYIVDAFVRDVPPAEPFDTPDGYTKAASPIAVVTGAGRRPVTTPLMTPSPQPT